MAKIIFEVPTFAQAKMMASWYDGQGEQDIGVWAEVSGVVSPMVQNITFSEEEEIVTVSCRNPRSSS
jgi:hypothetical protein